MVKFDIANVPLVTHHAQTSFADSKHVNSGGSLASQEASAHPVIDYLPTDR